jgi:hypothetical protein
MSADHEAQRNDGPGKHLASRFQTRLNQRMDEKHSQRASAKGGWWLLWFFAAVAMPGVAPFCRAETALALCVGGLVLHFIASMKLDRTAFWQSALIFCGGWLLMAVSFFAGCVYAPV